MKLEDFLLREEGDDSRHLADGRVAATWDNLGKCWNIGPGLTNGVTKNTVWTQEELHQHEEAEFAATKAAVANLVKVHLGENRTTVLESFTYNCGISALAHSSILRSVNANQFDAVPSELRQWVHARGARGPVPGLVHRRNDEVRLWNTPDSAPPLKGLMTSRRVPRAFTSDLLASEGFIPDPQPAVFKTPQPVPKPRPTLTDVLRAIDGLRLQFEALRSELLKLHCDG